MCSDTAAAFLYPKSSGEHGAGWVKTEPDVERAFNAFENGTLQDERFKSFTKGGKQYTIKNADRLGVVLHRDGLVHVFCVDLDDHTDDGGNVGLEQTLARFLGAQPIVFTSKGGKGVHCFYQLKDPMPIREFVHWCKRWGFNRKDQPEVFPKTENLNQVWLPGEPNDSGGDVYRLGTFESCVVDQLPQTPPTDLTSTTLSFLRGEATQPGRNDSLNKAAFELGSKQLDRQVARALCHRGAALCGLEQTEIDSTFNSGFAAGSRSPAAIPVPDTRITLHEDGIASGEWFVEKFGGQARYCIELNKWFIWNSTRWVPDQIRVEAMAKEAARSIENSSLRKAACREKGIKEMLAMARSEPGIAVSHELFDGDPMLFNCKSGTIDLRDGSIMPHRPQDLLSKISPVLFEQTKSCPAWLKFLDTVMGGDQEMIDYIQRISGYMLTGDVREQHAFFLYGDGGNGKSVFCSLLQHILGDYAVRTPSETIMQRVSSAGGASPDLARLRGARLAVGTEIEDGQRINEARLKDMTGCDRIVARALYKEPIEFDPTFKLLFYGNHKPEIAGTNHGIWRRIRLLSFTAKIAGHDRDPNLLDKLKNESGAILAWMVEGCLKWQSEGLGLPEAVKRATGEYRSESDPVGRFFSERCRHVAGNEITKGELYDAYRAWCTDNGETPISSKALNPKLKALGLIESRNKHTRTWVGAELLESDS